MSDSSSAITGDAPGRSGWYHRLHALFMAKGTATYEQILAQRKRALFGDLHGTVLEIGPGAGPNLRYYPADTQWIGVEPNVHMHPYLRREAERLGRPITIITGTADQIAMPDSSVDAVVSTLVLCSVPDVATNLTEIGRVLKPGGRFLFIEHVAAPPGTRLRRVQGLIRPLWSAFADGCHPDRDTGATLDAAGFKRVRYQPFTVPAPIIGPHIMGVATK
jgi:ubiquinone/menaquinone biosynthesis C-methylase UbiE